MKYLSVMQRRHLLIIFFSFFVFLSFKAVSQFIANAGNDTLICVSFQGFIPIELGGNPTASGGSGNYYYNWTGSGYSASDFLDDINSSNPLLEYIPSDSITFYVTVTDDSGNVCDDSIKLIFDQWACNLGECYFVINEGDSVTLSPSCISNFPPYTYQWNPDYQISDTNAATPWVWPDSTTIYVLTMTDSRKCYAPFGTCTVKVNPSSVFPVYLTESFSEVFPDPVNESSSIRFENSFSRKVRLEIFNFHGDKIFQSTTYGNTIQIGNAIQASGEYFYLIFLDARIISTGRFTRSD